MIDAIKLEDVSYIFLTLLIFFTLIGVPTEFLFAASDSMVFDVPLCKAMNILTGPPGKTVTGMAIGGVAGGALFGKISPATALVVCAACAGLLGAPKIAQMLASGVGDTSEGFLCEDIA